MMRPVAQPDRRIQDGPTRKWLCDDCELRFSKWENQFKETIFSPVHEQGVNPFSLKYGPWAIKFAASISWRVLLYYESDLSHLRQDDIRARRDASQSWRDFLFALRPNVGTFDQHLLFVDAPGEVTGAVSPYLARYMTRTVHTDIVRNERYCFTYAKMGKIIVIGSIRAPTKSDWRGTKLGLQSGNFRDSLESRVPPFMARYWNEKADQVAEAFVRMSPRQRQKIDEMFQKANPDVLANSDVFAAMEADVALSGSAAFHSTSVCSEAAAIFDSRDALWGYDDDDGTCT